MACRNVKGRKRRIVRFVGVTADSRKLGVNIRTLQRTLLGEWKLPGLLSRYRSLKAKESKQNRLKSVRKKTT